NLLDTRLRAHGYRRVPVIGDGNCCFRAIINCKNVWVWKNACLRKGIENMKKHRNIYEDFLWGSSDDALSPGDRWNDYIQRMETDGAWADHEILAAVAAEFNFEFKLITTHPSDEIRMVSGPPAATKTTTPPRQIVLAFKAEVHYDAVSPLTSFSSSTASHT
ncbi:unnamed protein product, partial [Amoebophrya sp. A120]